MAVRIKWLTNSSGFNAGLQRYHRLISLCSTLKLDTRFFRCTQVFNLSYWRAIDISAAENDPRPALHKQRLAQKFRRSVEG